MSDYTSAVFRINKHRTLNYGAGDYTHLMDDFVEITDGPHSVTFITECSEERQMLIVALRECADMLERRENAAAADRQNTSERRIF